MMDMLLLLVKQAGMGCGQLSAEQIEVAASGGHLLAPAGIFTD